MNKKLLIENLRTVRNFPIKGIQFIDVSTLFKSSDCLRVIVEELHHIYKDKGITKVVGLESRGFVVGSALAYRLGAGFVMCRKHGKLPAQTVKKTYTKEYGEDTIEIHSDAIEISDTILLHDDILATGGSMKATLDLVKEFNPQKIYINFLVELKIEGLNGMSQFGDETEITTLLQV